MNTKPLTDIADDLEHGGITKKLAARKLRDWIKENKNFNLPLTPIQPPYAPMPTPYPQPRPPFGYKNSCPKCGITLSGVMGYSCPNSDCPVGLGPIMCGGTTYQSEAGRRDNVKIAFSDGSTHVYGKEDGQIIVSFTAAHALLGVSVNGKELKSAINVEYL